jgi:hypothetical protein
MPSPLSGLKAIVDISRTVLGKVGISAAATGKVATVVADELVHTGAAGKALTALSLDSVVVGREIAPVRQGLNRCGPATLETITKLLGIPGYEQKQIARTMLKLPKTYDWQQFPGASLGAIRRYLTKHPHLVGSFQQPASFAEAEKAIQASLRKGRPVMMAIDVNMHSPKFIQGLVSHAPGESPIVGHWVVIRGYNAKTGAYQVCDVLSHSFSYELSAAKLAKKWSFDVPGRFDLLSIGHR